MSSPGIRPNPLVLTALFVCILLVYVLTLCPTVYWEDSGELITVAYVLGIAHPPGHPLYSIVGHLFTFLPWGTIAARVNLMSAFFGALAAALVYPAVLCIIHEVREKSLLIHVSGVTAALFAAFGVTLWDQSVVAETSTLHAFFFMVLLLLFITLIHAPDDRSFMRRLFLFSFVFGLSLTNHVAGVFLIPAFALWALLTVRRKILRPSLLLLSPLFLLAGLSVYLYLPIRSSQDPIIDWGNPETVSAFWQVVTASQFQRDVFALPSAGAMLEIGSRHLSNIYENFLAIGIIFIIAGLWHAFRRRKAFLLFALVAIGTLFFVTLNPAFIGAYFIPALLLLSILLGLGANACAGTVLASVNNNSLKRPAMVAAFTLLAAAPVLPLVRHYPINDRSDCYRAREYGMRILDLLPQDAVFFSIDLNAMFAIWYLKYCEGIRGDVLAIEPTWLVNSDAMREEILNRHPELLMPEIGEKVVSGARLGSTSLIDRDLLLAVFRKNAATRPVYLSGVPMVPGLRPRGLVYEFVETGANLFDEPTVRWHQDYWEAIAREFSSIPEMASDRVAMLIYPENLRIQGMLFHGLGHDDLAQWTYELAIGINPAYAPLWYHLGRLREDKGDYEQALNDLATASELDYRFRSRANFARGRILYKTGHYDRAVSEILGVIGEDAGFPGAHNMLGSLYLAMEMPDRAEAEFYEEIRHAPMNSTAYLNLAGILIRRGDLEEAESILRAGINSDAGSAQSYYLLAKTVALRGNWKEAATMLDTAIEIGGPQFLQMADNDAVLSKIPSQGRAAESEK